MHATRRAAAVKVSKCASEFKHAVIAARRKTKSLGGVAQQRKTRCVRFRDLLYGAGRRAGVANDAIEPEFGVTRELNLRAAATLPAASAEPSRAGGIIRSAARTEGTSTTRSKRSRSGPDRRPRYWATHRSFGARLQA